jgi:proteasome accessory factor C
LSETAAAQLRRVLHLIPRLADGEAHSLSEIAEQAGADLETVHGDLWSLVTRFHDPGGFVEGVQLYIESDRVELISNHFRRPMRLTTSELCALELGLAMLRTERPPDECAAIDRARERLRKLIAKLPADAMPEAVHSAEVGAAGDPAHLATARAALRDRRKLSLRYRRGDAEWSDDRVVCPYALVASSGMFYIVAFCDRSEGVRIFRLDRIEEARLTQDRFAIPESFSIDRFLHDGRALQAGQPEAVRVRYSPRVARWIAEREGVPLDGDGSLTLSHPLADAAWAVRHVLQYGAEAEVLEPAEVRELVRSRLQEMARSRA